MKRPLAACEWRCYEINAKISQNGDTLLTNRPQS
jgi:hypothetical protein